MANPTVGLIISSKARRINAPGPEFYVVYLSNSINFGLGFGAGISFLIGRTLFSWKDTTLMVSPISLMMAKIREGGEEIELEEGTDVTTKGIQIMAGITFPFGGF